MSESTWAATRGFFYALLSDERGVPDDSIVAFLIAVIVLSAGAFVPHFPLTTYAAAVCALIPLYKAARGDWRKP